MCTSAKNSLIIHSGFFVHVFLMLTSFGVDFSPLSPTSAVLMGDSPPGASSASGQAFTQTKLVRLSSSDICTQCTIMEGWKYSQLIYPTGKNVAISFCPHSCPFQVLDAMLSFTHQSVNYTYAYNKSLVLN